MPSVTCLRLSDVSVICRVTYFQFPTQVCFSSMSVLSRPHSGVLVYAISDIERCQKFGRYLSCTERTVLNDFEFILTVKWKLDTP